MLLYSPLYVFNKLKYIDARNRNLNCDYAILITRIAVNGDRERKSASSGSRFPRL